MSDQDVSGAGPHDVVVLHLQGLRRAAGEPSYAEIARWVGRLRVSRGHAASAAVPPRTTVYDAFRLGRRRLDRDLVADITVVLDEEIRSRSPESFPGGFPAGSPGVANDGALDGVSVTPAPAGSTPLEAGPASGRASGPVPVSATIAVPVTVPVTVLVPGPAPITDPTPLDAVEPSGESLAAAGPTRRFVPFVLALALGTNLFGQTVATWLDLPIWQDMTGSAIAAIAVGPWWGVLVAVVTMAVDVAMFQETGFWFLPVSVLGALIWGYGAGRGRMVRSTPRFLLLNVQVAVACTIVAVPITLWRFGGYTSHDSSGITHALADVLPALALAVVLSNLVFSLCDKLVSGFIALAVLDGLAADRPWLEQRLRPQGARVVRSVPRPIDDAAAGE